MKITVEHEEKKTKACKTGQSPLSRFCYVKKEGEREGKRESGCEEGRGGS